jgi:hypothetical protein
MQIPKQLNNKCTDANCPPGIEQVRKIGLTPKEKRAIFFNIKEKIFRLKKRSLP